MLKKSLPLLLLLVIFHSPARAEIRVQSFLGSAEVMQNGEWHAVEAGANLPAETVVRTNDNSHLQLLLPGGAFARILDKSKCKIVETTDAKKVSSVSLGLESGAMILSVVETKRKPKISLPDKVTVEGEGLFLVRIEDKEKSVVSALKGEACVTPDESNGKKTCLKKGQDLGIEKGKPGAPKEMSDKNTAVWKAQKFISAPEGPKLFLKIIQPEENKNFDTSSIFVVGKTLPGAQVRVNGKPMEVNESGGFNGSIALFEGENNIAFSATSTEGETLSDVRHVFLDSTPPLLMVNQPLDNFDPSVIGNCDARQCAIQIFGLTEPGVLLNINGLDASRFVSDDGSFLIQDFPVRFDENLLTIYAQDTFQRRTFGILHIETPQDTDGDGAYDFLDACPADPSC